MKELMKKGYTLEAISWENDGDYYATKQFYVGENKDTAIAIAKMASILFKSCNNGDGGIGNTNEGDEKKAEETIYRYLTENNVFDNQADMTESELLDAVMSINYSLLGTCEYYYSRVLEKITILYTPIDIQIEEIPFKNV